MTASRVTRSKLALGAVRPPPHRLRAALAGLLLVWLALPWGCGGPSFTLPAEAQRPPSLRAVRSGTRAAAVRAIGHPRPKVRIRPIGGLTEGYEVQVVQHGPSPLAGYRRLLLSLPSGPPVALDYTTYAGYELPLRRGERVYARFYPRRVGGPEGDRHGYALVFRELEGPLIAAVFSGSERPPDTESYGLPMEELPYEIDLRPSRRLVYTEVRRLSSLCLATIEHRRLRIQLGPNIDLINPGTWTVVGGPEGDYRLISMDTSDLLDRVSCAEENPGHFSFVMLAEDRVSGGAVRARPTPATPATPATE